MTGKERAAFRAQANHLEPLFQVGKGGMSDALIKQTDDALRARELIKVKVLLESSPITPRETADALAEATGAEVIQVIGGVIVLYRESPELKEKALQKENNNKRFRNKEMGNYSFRQHSRWGHLQSKFPFQDFHSR